MATLLEYKCPSCGGALQFNSDVQRMKCPYCETELEVETLRQLDQLAEDPGEQMEWEAHSGAWRDGEAEKLVGYVCQSCGGEILTEATTAATSCPYCDNPVVMVRNVSGAVRPDCVIPFQLDKAAAQAALKNHLQGKPLLPKAFKSENHIQEIKGVYVPFWLYDAHASGKAQYRATRVRSWSTSRYIYTETSHYSVHRAGEMDFVAVPVDGSSKMADDLMESLEPFDASRAVPFQPAYLAGYYADKYDVDANQCVHRANSRIRVSTERALYNTVIGYTSVMPQGCTVQLRDNERRYALFPVWLLTTKYRGETYHFAMNGQTGKLVGNLPISWGAFFKWWAIVAGGVSALATGLCYLLG